MWPVRKLVVPLVSKQFFSHQYTTKSGQFNYSFQQFSEISKYSNGLKGTNRLVICQRPYSKCVRAGTEHLLYGQITGLLFWASGNFGQSHRGPKLRSNPTVRKHTSKEEHGRNMLLGTCVAKQILTSGGMFYFLGSTISNLNFFILCMTSDLDVTSRWISDSKFNPNSSGYSSCHPFASPQEDKGPQWCYWYLFLPYSCIWVILRICFN